MNIRWTRASLVTLAAALIMAPAVSRAKDGGVVGQIGARPFDLGLTDTESVRHFEQEPTPAAKAPNVIYIVLDDTGYSDLGCFGSEINTPAMDRLAKEGLRYNNFHSRAICSPTRAALLTGRNSHSVGMANVTNMLSGFPHGQGRVTHSAATLAEILQAQGYRTFAVGKWHLAPLSQTSSREHWPVGRGFDQYYGFLDGMTDQFFPDIVVDNTPINKAYKDGYHFSEDMIEHAIGYVAAEKAASPDRPFFLYVSFGATHAPHQVPQSYVRKYENAYDKGWDAIREERFARQKALGLIPQNAQLAPRNPDVKAWASLTPEEKRLNSRFQAAYAGFLEHTDEQIGKLISFLEKSGQLDNTMIVLTSDNGGSVEGHQTGTLNEVSSLNQIPEKPSEMVKRVDEIGSKTAYPNYPSGWAQVSSTPFQFYKTSVWDGGLRTPLIVRYPQLIKGGQIRSQFVDVIDMTPTVLDVVGVQSPSQFKGVAQMPMHGASIRASFSDPSAPPSRETQYFELLGQRAIWHDGWKAISDHKAGEDFAKDKWHLYNLKQDFSAVRDVAGSNPEKLEEMKARWWAEAGKYGVLPLVNAPLYGSFSNDASGAAVPPYKTRRDTRQEYIYFAEQAQLLRADAPQIGLGSFTITAHLSPTKGTEQGVIVADGDRFGGYSLYLKDGYLTFEQSDLGHSRSVVRARQPISTGVRSLGVKFKRTNVRSGLLTLLQDGKPIGEGEIERRSTNLTAVSGFGIGKDVSGPVTDAYPEGGFPLDNGALEKVIVTIDHQ